MASPELWSTLIAAHRPPSAAVGASRSSTDVWGRYPGGPQLPLSHSIPVTAVQSPPHSHSGEAENDRQPVPQALVRTFVAASPGAHSRTTAAGPSVIP